METVNIHQAKTHLSRLLSRAAKGETIIIAKSGKPIAKVVPLDQSATPVPRRIGFLAGQGKVPDDFDRMFSKEIEALFGAA